MSRHQHFFCYLQPTRPNLHLTVTKAEMAVFDHHSAYLKKCFAEKKVLQAGTSFEKDAEHFAIVILQADNKVEALALMNADPAVVAGLLTARVTEYDVFLDRGLS